MHNTAPLIISKLPSLPASLNCVRVLAAPGVGHKVNGKKTGVAAAGHKWDFLLFQVPAGAPSTGGRRSGRQVEAVEDRAGHGGVLDGRHQTQSGSPVRPARRTWLEDVLKQRGPAGIHRLLPQIRSSNPRLLSSRQGMRRASADQSPNQVRQPVLAGPLARPRFSIHGKRDVDFGLRARRLTISIESMRRKTGCLTNDWW